MNILCHKIIYGTITAGNKLIIGRQVDTFLDLLLKVDDKQQAGGLKLVMSMGPVIEVLTCVGSKCRSLLSDERVIKLRTTKLLKLHWGLVACLVAQKVAGLFDSTFVAACGSHTQDWSIRPTPPSSDSYYIHASINTSAAPSYILQIIGLPSHPTISYKLLVGL